jgi:hypothetical protein
MGLTTGCAQCHNHKFDPLTHTDFYALMALLNNADEPNLQVGDPRIAAERQLIEREIQALLAALPAQFPPDDGEGTDVERRQRHFRTALEQWAGKQREQVSTWNVLVPEQLDSNLPHKLTIQLQPRHLPVHALRIEALPDGRLPAGGPGNAYYEGRKGGFFLSEVTARLEDMAVPIDRAQASHGTLSVVGENPREQPRGTDQLSGPEAQAADHPRRPIGDGTAFRTPLRRQSRPIPSGQHDRSRRSSASPAS